MEKQLDRIMQELGEIKIQQAVCNENLKEHMRRTDLLEKMYGKLEESLKPIQKHVHYVDGVCRFLGILSLVAGLIHIFFQLF